MTTDSNSETVDVTIRCAFQTAPDQTLTIPLRWTIRDLKEHIHEVYPNQPAVTSQRLIYCGGCLTDERVLHQVFDETRRVIGGPQVLHLVCPLPQGSPRLQRRVHDTTTGDNSSSPITPPSYDSMMDSWNEYYLRGGDTTTAQYHSNYYRAYINYWQQYQREMAGAMNGTAPSYPHQIFVQNGHGVPIVPYFTGPNGQQPVNLTGVPGGINVQFNRNAPNDRAQEPQANDNVNNAINVDGGGRGVGDGLELFYKCVRVAFLLVAVLLYTTLERFMLVVAIIMVILLTQFRRAQNRRAERAVPPGINNNNAGEDDQASSPSGVAEDESTMENTAQERPLPAVEPPPPTGLQVFVATCYSFVTSFLASLVPDHVPPPVDMN